MPEPSRPPPDDFGPDPSITDAPADRCFGCGGEGTRTLYKTSQGWLVCMSSEYRALFRDDVETKIETCEYCRGSGQNPYPCMACEGTGEIVNVSSPGMPDGRMVIRHPYAELMRDDVLLDRQPCPACEGTGNAPLDLPPPPGVDENDEEDIADELQPPNTLGFQDPPAISEEDLRDVLKDHPVQRSVLREDGTINPRHVGFAIDLQGSFADLTEIEQRQIRSRLRKFSTKLAREMALARLPENAAEHIGVLSAPFYLDDDDGDEEVEQERSPRGGVSV
mgnify:CR=1 FL=1